MQNGKNKPRLETQSPASKGMYKRLMAILLSVMLSTSTWAQEHTLNLQDADIQVLVATVAEITGRNFIIDPKVTGKVTVISSAPMDEDQIYRLFLSILQVHGFAAVSNEDVVKIVPDIAARQTSDSNEAMITRVLPVKSVSATELLPVLRPLMPAQGHLVALEDANALVVADRADNVARIEQLLRRIDRASDQEVEAIALSHANASELVRTINALYPKASGQTAIADERSNTVLLAADPSTRLKLRTLITHLDTPLESGGATQVVYLRYANADDLLPILQETLQSISGVEGSPGMTIQAHEETNSLVITAPQAIFRSLQSVIRQLDVRRAQVLVEAIIAEVSEETVKELGIQWQIFDSLSDGSAGAFGGTNFSTGGNNILGLSGGFADGVLPGNGLNIGYVGGTTTILGNEVLEIGALLRAISTDTDSNVLSTPSIVSLDNSEAEIYVGQEVPFLTGQFTNTGLANQDGQVNPFQTIQRNEVGIRLTVTPHINEGDTVVLDLSQEVSSIAPIVGATDIITNKRSLKTSVMVPDNTILVLGGLITDELKDTEDRVPGFSRIPLLGELFKYRNSNKVKRNLMLFIRPRILHESGNQEALSSEKYNFLRSQQLNARQKNRHGLTPEEEMPLLPELFDYLQTPVAEPPDEQ